MSHVLKNSWQPTITQSILEKRAAIIASIRDFFKAHKVLEVQTPVLCANTATDPHIKSISLQYDQHHNKQQTLYLQTSPEFAMKRLLAADSGCIFQICQAFRNGEQGRLHNPEFTMLEWYRLDFDHHALMDETDQLLQLTLKTKPANKKTYQQIFEEHTNLNPHITSVTQLKEFAKSKRIHINTPEHNRDNWLNIIMTHLIEPQLGQDKPIFIYDYPATQAALAKIRNDQFPVAERFEVYYQGIELANGYNELTDANELAKRSQQDQQTRIKLKYDHVPTPSYLIAAMQQGLQASH